MSWDGIDKRLEKLQKQELPFLYQRLFLMLHTNLNQREIINVVHHGKKYTNTEYLALELSRL